LDDVSVFCRTSIADGDLGVMDSPEGPLPPEVEPLLPGPDIPDRRGVITQGLVWTGLLQVFLVGANFVSMLVLVRLLRPSEYGQATAATGVLALINCFNCSYFVAQALQLHEGEEPDWAAHWNAGFYIQFALFIACNVIGLACWMLPAYRPMAGLLNVASIGLLIDCPNQIGLTWLRRDFNYRTLRLVQAVCTSVTVVSSISLALAGAGAVALIVGSNVLHGLPLGLYLLFVKRWRPPGGWWRWPNWKEYLGPLQFGAQLSGSAVLTAGRGILESTVLPVTLGYEAVGLLNRAQVLFSTTGGRVAAVVVETVYPLLPRSAGNPEQFSRHATLFVHTMLLISIPGAAFVGIEGPSLSRLLYGATWVAADPLILPGTVFAWAVSTVMIFATVLQAKNQLRLAFTSSLIAAVSCLPAMFVAITGEGTLRYAWALGIGQAAAAVIAAKLATKLLQRRWFGRGVLPAILAAGAGSLVILLIDARIPAFRPLWRILIDATAFGFVILLVLRAFFGSLLLEVVLRLPGRDFMRGILRV
jgi:O-antigen/teichoic acid export membrane protein